MKAKGKGRAIRQFSSCSCWSGKSLGKVSLLVKVSVVLKTPDKSNLRDFCLQCIKSTKVGKVL